MEGPSLLVLEVLPPRRLNPEPSSFPFPSIQVFENHEWGWGYNAASNVYENLLQSGVVDSAKVVINALENSASIAAMVLTTECLITEIPERKSAAQEAADYDGGQSYM
jgi:chaperonin GroEL